MIDFEKEKEDNITDENIENTGSQNLQDETADVDENKVIEEVQFDETQKKAVNKIVKEAIAKIKADLSNKQIDLESITRMLEEKDISIASLNDKLVVNDLLSRNIKLTDKQLEMIKKIVPSFSIDSIDEIVDHVKEMIGHKTEFVEEQIQDEKPKTNKNINNRDNPLDLD